MALFFYPQYFYLYRRLIEKNALVLLGEDFHIIGSCLGAALHPATVPLWRFYLQNCQAAERSSGLLFYID